MTSDDDQHLAAAERLSRQAGWPAPVAIAPLPGGRNNRVFRVDYGENRQSTVLKRYFFAETDRRDRLGAEWAFLTHATRLDIAAVPEPLAAEAESRNALYAYIDGERPRPGDVGAAELHAALDFIAALNAAPRDLALFADASEACFSLGAHLATVDRRMLRLEQIDPDAPYAAEVVRLVAGMLAPAWRRIRERIVEQARAHGEALDTPLDGAATCLSPSDFGFHNAIRRAEGTMVFIDFEYAGRDDAAKLVCDFFCQPEVPVPLDYWGLFCDRVIANLSLDVRHRARFDLLLDAYRVKWICIVLNDFLPGDGARRDFASTDDRTARCAAQLSLAQARTRQLTSEVL